MAKSKQVNRDPNAELAILVLAALILFFAAITIPVGDKKDVYIDFKVQKELTSSPKLIEVNARVQPSTILEVPEFMGAVWGVQAGDVSVIANSTTVKSAVSIGDVTTGFDAKKRMILKGVPTSESEVRLALYEGKELREVKVIKV